MGNRWRPPGQPAHRPRRHHRRWHLRPHRELLLHRCGRGLGIDRRDEPVDHRRRRGRHPGGERGQRGNGLPRDRDLHHQRHCPDHDLRLRIQRPPPWPGTPQPRTSSASCTRMRRIPTLGREGVYTLRGTAACVAGQSCTPANACHTGVTTCTGTPACADAGTNVADGAPCGSGNVCTAGACSPLTCNPIPITGLNVSETRVAASKPTPLGGTIADGIYDLSSYSLYTGPGGASGPTGFTLRCTMVISGTVGQEACGAGATGVPKSTFNYVLSGTRYTITSAVCGTADVGYTMGFTATPTELWGIGDSPGNSGISRDRLHAAGPGLHGQPHGYLGDAMQFPFGNRIKQFHRHFHWLDVHKQSLELLERNVRRHGDPDTIGFREHHRRVRGEQHHGKCSGDGVPGGLVGPGNRGRHLLRPVPYRRVHDALGAPHRRKRLGQQRRHAGDTACHREHEREVHKAVVGLSSMLSAPLGLAIPRGSSLVWTVCGNGGADSAGPSSHFTGARAARPGGRRAPRRDGLPGDPGGPSDPGHSASPGDVTESRRQQRCAVRPDDVGRLQGGTR